MTTEIIAQAACAKCLFWKASAGETGECRRRAPQALVFKVDDATKFESHFPATQASDWCGEFAAK